MVPVIAALQRIAKCNEEQKPSNFELILDADCVGTQLEQSADHKHMCDAHVLLFLCLAYMDNLCWSEVLAEVLRLLGDCTELCC